jgi:hypothetical protein
MVRIPVTLADFDSGRIKSSVSKLSKHHPDQPLKPKLSVVQRTFAQILGYGGFEDLRSQAKQNGAIYSGQSLAIGQFIAPISRRLSRHWNVSAEKAEGVAAELGLMHLDAFRPAARPVQQLVLREDRVSPSGQLPSIGVSTRPIFDAVRQATGMPVAQMAALREAMKPMDALREAMRPMDALQEAMRPMDALQEAMRPMDALREAMRPMAALREAMRPMAALRETMKPTAQMLAIQEAMKPTSQMLAIQEAMKPTAQMLAIQEAMKPTAQMLAIQEAMKPTAQMHAIQEAMKPTAHMLAILDALKSKTH